MNGSCRVASAANISAKPQRLGRQHHLRHNRHVASLIKGITENLPNAEITFDKFHVVAHANP
jgi:transposase